MDWFLFAFLGGLCFATYTLVVRTALAEHGDARSFAVLSNLVVGSLLLLIAPFEQPTAELSPARMLWWLTSSIAYAAASSLLIWGRQLEQVSVASVASQTNIGWTLLGGVLVLGEPFTLAKLLGVLLILGGTLIALWEHGHVRATRGVAILLTGACIASSSTLIDKTMVSRAVSPALYLGVAALLAGGWLFLALPERVERVRAEARLQGWRIAAVSVLLAASLLLVMQGLARGEASRVSPVYYSSVLISVVAAIVVLHERDRIVPKLLGAVVGLSGVALLRLGG